MYNSQSEVSIRI